MKVCHVITRMILGGAMENTLLTCEGLHERGHEVTLITGPALGPEGELMTRARAGGYRVEVVDALRREIRPRDVKAYRRIGRLLAEIGPDVMHSHASKAGILARRAAARRGGMAVVHTIHGLPFHPYQSWAARRLFVHLERVAALRTDAILCVADAMTRQALAAGVGSPEQFTTVYSGMEVGRFLDRPAEADEVRGELGIPGEVVLVTQVSRLAELKGHEFIIQAAKGLGDHVHFCFVGDGHLRTNIERQIGEAGLADRFHLTGLVAPERIPALLHASDVLVHCSLREGLARALPQGMLTGLPAVSFDVDGAGEVVSERTGVLLAPGDVEGLRRALQTLAEDAALRERLGRAGRALCRDRFDHRRMVEQIEAVYERLLARSPD